MRDARIVAVRAPVILPARANHKVID